MKNYFSLLILLLVEVLATEFDYMVGIASAEDLNP
jgi:hypothetical protein